MVARNIAGIEFLWPSSLGWHKLASTQFESTKNVSINKYCLFSIVVNNDCHRPDILKKLPAIIC